MATLKEFEDALRQHGMVNALAILEGLKKRDREKRSVAPARRVVGRKMTTELARTVLELHATTGMTQQEIAFKLGVNQGRVNEVVKRGKWLSGDLSAPEIVSRDKAMQRLAQRATARRAAAPVRPGVIEMRAAAKPVRAAAELQCEQPPGAVTREADELPFDGPTVVRLQKGSDSASKAPLRRTPDGVSPIVSAQLAFLDL